MLNGAGNPWIWSMQRVRDPLVGGKRHSSGSVGPEHHQMWEEGDQSPLDGTADRRGA